MGVLPVCMAVCHVPAVPMEARRGLRSWRSHGSCLVTSCLSPQGLKISVLWTLYYGVLSAFAPVYSWILVLRGLVGFGIGGVPQS